MGTRSLTRLYNEDKQEICVLYRQLDGYPEGHGKELASFLEGFTIVNGYNSDMEGKVANGANCLVAQVISHFKRGVGTFYLYPPGTNDMGEEYVYDVYCSVSGGIELVVSDVAYITDNRLGLGERFRGTPEEYKDWLTMLEE